MQNDLEVDHNHFGDPWHQGGSLLGTQDWVTFDSCAWRKEEKPPDSDPTSIRIFHVAKEELAIYLNQICTCTYNIYNISFIYVHMQEEMDIGPRKSKVLKFPAWKLRKSWVLRHMSTMMSLSIIHLLVYYEWQLSYDKYIPEVSHSLLKMMVGRLDAFWDGSFLGGELLNLGYIGFCIDCVWHDDSSLSGSCFPHRLSTVLQPFFDT